MEAQLRALRKSPVDALRRSDRTCLTFTQKRLLLGLRYSWKEGIVTKFHKSQSKVIDKRHWRKKYTK